MWEDQPVIRPVCTEVGLEIRSILAWLEIGLLTWLKLAVATLLSVL